MQEIPYDRDEFLDKVIGVIEENISDEDFSVEELAERVHMSRSNLLRKVKSSTGISVSVLIREVRLYQAKRLLQSGSLTASQVSYKVGFSSTSYFTKCFRELFGYTPGEEGKNPVEAVSRVKSSRGNKKWTYGLAVIGIVALIGIGTLYMGGESSPKHSMEKSIAVLPFKNDSNDSSNVYFTNGLRDAILDDLQKVEDLKVTSRTTIDHYREISMSVPQLSRELGVNYFVEGSGQKIGNKILLSIQLIEASSDQQIWSKRYERESTDVFSLQTEVAQSIASEIEAVITPQEKDRMEKVPTENLVAYDFYLKGLDVMNRSEDSEELSKAIGLFQKAIGEDNGFAHAYANIAICYYYLDLFQAEKLHNLELRSNAEKAMEIDPDLGLSMVANGVYHLQSGQYVKAIEFFEKVLEYNPNSAWIHNFLSDIYTFYVPDSEKYLKHALAGIQTAVAGQDSASVSVTYLHLGNALAQSGFLDEAERYIGKSRAYDPENHYSEYLHAYIRLGQNLDVKEARDALLAVLEKDTTRLDVLQETAKLHYVLEEYETAWKYYEQFLTLRDLYQLNIFSFENLKIGFVLEQLGREDVAKVYYDEYKPFAESDNSIYRDLAISSYHAAVGEVEPGIKKLKAFSEQRHIQFWFILFLEDDPIMKKLSSHPDYASTMKKIRDQFWKDHQEKREMLEEEGLF